MKTSVAPFLRSSSDLWYTPRWLLEPLGRFDLDPANSAPARFPTARRHYGRRGLERDWRGRVWLNPPFSNARPWIERLVDHGNGIALVFCRSDAVWFQEALRAARCILLLKGRVQFSRPKATGKTEGRCPLGCVLLAFGERNAQILRTSGLPGVFLKPAA